MAAEIPSDRACILCEYIHAGDLEGVRKCLRDVSTAPPVCTCSPMMHSAFDSYFTMTWMRRNSHLAELLLDHGRDIDQPYGTSLESLIHLAIREDDEEMVKLLIHFGANLNRVSSHGYTPLGLALSLAQPKGTAISKMLVQSGASPYKKSTISIFQIRIFAPLHIACFKGNFEFVKFLVEEKFTHDNFLGDYLEETSTNTSIPSSCWDQPHGERLVLEEKENSTTCKSGREENHTSPTISLKDLLNQPADDGSTPLFMAASSGDLQLVEYLLRAGADPHFVCLSGNFLHAAVKSKSLDVIKKGFELGVDINHRTSLGDTPLHLASRIDLPEACELLVIGGADLNARRWLGETPLMYSVIAGCDRNTRVLIKHGSDVNAVDNMRMTSLYWCFGSHETTIQFLLLAGARLTSHMLSALHYKFLVTLTTPSLSSWIRQHMNNPQSLLVLSCLVIRNQLINVSNGRSILWRIESLPIPNPLKDLLFLKDINETM